MSSKEIASGSGAALCTTAEGFGAQSSSSSLSLSSTICILWKPVGAASAALAAGSLSGSPSSLSPPPRSAPCGMQPCSRKDLPPLLPQYHCLLQSGRVYSLGPVL